MYDQWTASEWQAASDSHEAGVAVADSPEVVSEYAYTEEEELPKPFLNEYLPTQAEIRRACLEIQQGWTDSERRRRRGYRRANRQPHMLRVVRTAFSG